jgi:Flp pilus assembly protein TadG
MRRVHRCLRDEAGMSFVFVGLGMMAFLSASMLAIDVGMLMTARNQAQNSADAGALAGATALVFDSYTDRSPTGPVVTSAIAGATNNKVMAGDVSVKPEDVEFPLDPNGRDDRVKVTVYRRAERGNPLSLLVARTLSIATGGAIGLETADISATATAEASPANAMTCVKPFTIPDKWIEKQTAPWDGSDTYDAFDNKGNPLTNPDIYIPADQSGYTGYNQESNRGQQLVIRAGTGNNITVSFYYSIAIGYITGGDPYRWNIANCNTYVMHWGEKLMQEPGAMEGPTIQGVEELIARDPNAHWNDVTKKVEGSAYPGQSPRVFPIPLYDPIKYDSGKRNGRTADLYVANWIGFFAESLSGNQVYGRIIPIAGIYDSNYQSVSGVFPQAIRLVK